MLLITLNVPMKRIALWPTVMVMMCFCAAVQAQNVAFQFRIRPEVRERNVAFSPRAYLNSQNRVLIRANGQITFLLCLNLTSAPLQPNAPIGKSGLLISLNTARNQNLLKDRRYVEGVIKIITQYGVNFQISQADEIELREAGANDSIINAIRNNHRPVGIKPPSTPTPKDITPPKIIITSPPLTRGQGVKPAAAPILKQSGSSLAVAGQATDESGVREVTVRGVAARLDERGNFSVEITLQVGDNPITVTATDNAGNRATESFTVRRESEPLPSPPLVSGRYFALLIAVQDYEHKSVTPLEYPLSDARKIERELTTVMPSRSRT